MNPTLPLPSSASALGYSTPRFEITRLKVKCPYVDSQSVRTLHVFTPGRFHATQFKDQILALIPPILTLYSDPMYNFKPNVFRPPHQKINPQTDS